MDFKMQYLEVLIEDLKEFWNWLMGGYHEK